MSEGVFCSNGHTILTMRVLQAVAACLLILLSGCRKPTEASATPRSVESPQPQVKRRPPELPDCDLPPRKLEASRIAGNHSVVLTWNPSDSSKGPDDQSVGYCLYRSNKDIPAKKLEDCRNCERVNRRPIFGVGCVDTHVKDGRTYYYVAGSTKVGSTVYELSHKTIAIVPSKPGHRKTKSQYPICDPDGPPEAAGQK